MALSKSKVYICPICAHKIDEIGLIKLEVVDSIWCYECEYHIIPLATPQEVR